MHPAIAVFTEKSADEILAAGGSGAWILDPKNAKKRRYLVCCRKERRGDLEGGTAHGAAFFVGLVKTLVPVGANERNQQRFHIAISDYVVVDLPGTWKGWRNPVKYTSLEELGIDPAGLKFVPAPAPKERSQTEWEAEIPRKSPGKLTIAQAKQGLAEMLGVSPENIEIIIRS